MFPFAMFSLQARNIFIHADIDECSDPSLNNCHSSAMCTNIVGGFTCVCNPGFVGNGVKCTGE